MRKQILRISTIFLIAVLSACGTPAPQTPLEAATPTDAPAQPTTQSPTSTDTPPPTSTATPSADASTEEPAASVSFVNDVLPIFNNSCIKCHGVEQIKEGLDLRSYETLMAGSFNGSVITPGSLDDSYLLQQIINGEMPNRGPKLSAEQVQIIANWINAGAPNN